MKLVDLLWLMIMAPVIAVAFVFHLVVEFVRERKPVPPSDERVDLE